MEQDLKYLSIWSILLYRLPDIAFINEEAAGSINEEALGKETSFFFYFMFNYFSPTSINRPDFSSDFMILI